MRIVADHDQVADLRIAINRHRIRFLIYKNAAFRYQYNMTQVVEPKPEFCSLTEEAVVAALQDPDPTNPVAVEVARLIERYTGNFQAHAEKLGRIPSDILLTKPRWPIEAVAMRLTTEVIREVFSPSASGKA